MDLGVGRGEQQRNAEDAEEKRAEGAEENPMSSGEGMGSG
jgi:hypothetical protein